MNLILNACSGLTAEAIDYPAQGDSAYGVSVQTDTQIIANQINSFNEKCTGSKLVVLGHSQVRFLISAEWSIMADQTREHKSETTLFVAAAIRTRQGISNSSVLLTSSANIAVKAIIWAGNPRNSPVKKSAFGYGTCTAQS